MPMWECACGHIEESEESAKECVHCGRLDEFSEVANNIPEDTDNELIDNVLEDKDSWRFKSQCL
tara:strand:+ start:117 stop:308 length:192 start_codon:yes stop_codon:yes gene_type:complete